MMGGSLMREKIFPDRVSGESKCSVGLPQYVLCHAETIGPFTRLVKVAEIDDLAIRFSLASVVAHRLLLGSKKSKITIKNDLGL
jgi:hypothetical protein